MQTFIIRVLYICVAACMSLSKLKRSVKRQTLTPFMHERLCYLRIHPLPLKPRSKKSVPKSKETNNEMNINLVQVCNKVKLNHDIMRSLL